jgi:hypothetical protein
MKTWPVIILAATIALLVRVPVSAHHGGAAFDNGKTVVLKGTVVEWIYSNPHCLLKLDVKGADGQVVQWIAEGQAPNVIFPAGYRKDSFKPGDQVAITVEPVKNNQPMGRILQSVLANGKALGRASSAGSDEAIQQKQKGQ